MKAPTRKLVAMVAFALVSFLAYSVLGLLTRRRRGPCVVELVQERFVVCCQTWRNGDGLDIPAHRACGVSNHVFDLIEVFDLGVEAWNLWYLNGPPFACACGDRGCFHHDSFDR